MPLSKPNSQEQREPARLCLKCGYCLHGLPINRCPECGNEFDPNDASTFTVARPVGSFVRLCNTAPGWLLIGVVCVLVLHSLIGSVMPGGWFGWQILSFFAWLVIGSVWLVRLLACSAVRFRYRALGTSPYHDWRRWAAIPVLLMLTIGMLYVKLPLRLGFLISRPALNRLVEQTRNSPPGTTLPDRRIGIYSAEDIETFTGGVRFIVRDTGLFDRAGFAFCTTGKPPRIGEDYYTRLTGHWYIWDESW